MNWFQRHLNWSLFLGLLYIPTNVGFTVGLVISIYMLITGLFAYGFSRELLVHLETGLAQFGEIPLIIISIVVLLLIVWASIRLGFWFLDRKGRSRALVTWLVAPPFVGFAISALSVTVFMIPFGIIAGIVVALLGPIVGLIILLVLENQGIGYGGDLSADFVNERGPDRWSDTSQYSGYDDRPKNEPDYTKELDYTPSQSVLDISASQPARDTGATRDIPDSRGVVDDKDAGEEEAPTPEKEIVRAVSQERLTMPILLDDAGAVIRCYYHPGADAVNVCTRCKQYVCNECNYVTGTHPICHNCWEKRAEVPIAAPAQKQASPPSVQPRKQEVVVPTQPVEQKDVEPVKPEQQKVVAPAKSAKLDAEKSEWLPEFMVLYQQALPIINVVTSKSADAMPPSPLDLMEGLKLRPMLERAKKLSKPKDKELREARSEFEQVLSSCIKIADAAADFVSGGGQALLGGPNFARIVAGIETANGLMGKLSRRLATFTQPQV